MDFQSSLKSAWLVLAAGAKQRIGFGRTVNREFNSLAQNSLVDVPAGGHRIERDLALLAPLGIRPRYAAPVLPQSAADREAVDAALAGRLRGGPLVVIHPGTSDFAAFKRWLPERYAAVADGLIARARRGRAGDLRAGRPRRGRRRWSRTWRRRARSRLLCGGCSSTCELLRRAALFIGSDTGPMHMASALGVPVVALFGPKDPVQTGPYCSRSIVVRGQEDCAPCTRRTCSHVRCMTSITAEQVLSAATDVLDGKGECRADACGIG